MPNEYPACGTARMFRALLQVLASHTLGRWRAEPEYLSAGNKVRTGRAQIWSDAGIYVGAVHFRDGPLAAAPELLTACRDARRRIACDCGAGGRDGTCTHALLSGAIAEGEGKA